MQKLYLLSSFWIIWVFVWMILQCKLKQAPKQACNNKKQLECGLMPNVMAALLNIVGALCSTPQSLADAQYWNAVQ